MIDKDPTSYSLVTYLWVFLLAILGGIVNFMRKLQAGHARVFNLIEFIGEIVTSAFAGVITFWLCENAGFPALMTAAFVGVSGHMGSRAIFMFENWLKAKFPA
jgi:asparagine N-glycosylation enzyme membrane subunit Stt3